MAEWLSLGVGQGPSMVGHTHCRDIPSRISSVKISLRYLQKWHEGASVVSGV